MDLFLIGKTGNGKSQSGNTILGREQFQTTDAGQSATLETDVAYTEIDGTIVKVVDGPGMVDTRKDAAGQQLQAEKKLGDGFTHCPRGFHGLLIVLKYGVRFTDEEVKTINILRAIFGPHFVKNHGILVFTHGENFLQQQKRNPQKTFEGWLKEQTGDLAHLIQECHCRAVLFYNLTDEKRDESLDLLFSFVKKIRKRYTGEMFQKVKQERDNFIRHSGAIQLKEEIQGEVSLLNAMLKPDDREPDMVVLGPLLDRLDRALQEEKDKSPVVKALQKGISEAKSGKFEEAYTTFRQIEEEGKGFLVKLAERVKYVVRSFVALFQGW